MQNNIMQADNIQQIKTETKNADPLAISYHLRRRPSYVQSYCILQCVAMSPRMKIYQVARVLGLDYYQAMKRVMEMSKKGFLKVVNGSMTITNEGVVLKEILGQVIILMHTSDANMTHKM